MRNQGTGSGPAGPSPAADATAPPTPLPPPPEPVAEASPVTAQPPGSADESGGVKVAFLVPLSARQRDARAHAARRGAARGVRGRRRPVRPDAARHRRHAGRCRRRRRRRDRCRRAPDRRAALCRRRAAGGAARAGRRRQRAELLQRRLGGRPRRLRDGRAAARADRPGDGVRPLARPGALCRAGPEQRLRLGGRRGDVCDRQPRRRADRGDRTLRSGDHGCVAGGAPAGVLRGAAREPAAAAARARGAQRRCEPPGPAPPRRHRDAGRSALRRGRAARFRRPTAVDRTAVAVLRHRPQPHPSARHVAVGRHAPDARAGADRRLVRRHRRPKRASRSTSATARRTSESRRASPPSPTTRQRWRPCSRAARAGRISRREAITNPVGFAGMDGVFRLLSDGSIERALAVIEVRRNSFRTISPAPETFEPTTQKSRAATPAARPARC